MRTSPVLVPGLLLCLMVAAQGDSGGPVHAREQPAATDQACQVSANRHYGGAEINAVAWGDEIGVEVELALDCGAGRATRLSITEALPAGIERVGGIGRAPDEVRGGALTWHVDQPPVAPATIRFAYRIYATPPWGAFDADGEQALAWPMLIDLTEAGTVRRQPVPDLAPARVREREGLGCGMARSRDIQPAQVLAGQPFEVKLRLTPSQCSPFARRTRGIIALQPYADPARMLQLAQVQTALLDPARVTPENAMFGVVVNGSGGPRVQPPTSEYIYLEDLVRGLPPDPAGGADAAAALAAGLDLLTDWPAHHELLIYITHPAAPRADPAAVRALRDEAARRGVEIAAICAGGGCDPALSYSHSAADLHILRREVSQGLLEAHRGPPLALDAIEVEERLLGFVQVEPGSVVPPAEGVGGHTLRWRVAAPAAGSAIEVGYRARIDIWGRLPLGIGGLARLRYAGGGQRSFDLPRGMVLVDRDPNAVPKPCRPVADKSATPRRLPLGDPVTVRLDFGAECPSEDGLVDVVLVLDVSGSMDGQPIVDAREAALVFLDILRPGPARVGLVTFDHVIVSRQPLTDDYSPLRADLAAMRARGGTDIAAGIRAAAELVLARRPGATPVIIVMTDGFNNDGPAPMLAAALDAKAQGGNVMTICFGEQGDCDPSLSDVASLPSLHFTAASSSDLTERFAELGLLLRGLGLASTRFVDVLPPHMRYLPGSAVPPPAEIRPATPSQGQTLVWDFADPPPGGVSARYQAEPLLLGPQATNATARATFVDDLSREGAADFPVPIVETYIPDPQGPCHPALGKAADRSRVEVGQAVGVSLSVRLDCPKHAVPLDIVLVVDHSSSMASLDRLANAKLAAGAFLDALDPGSARVGLVAFSTDVSQTRALTADLGQIRRAVDGLHATGLTGIATALTAARELLNQRRPEAPGAVLLLTDGVNTAGTPETMLAAAERLKNGGVMIVTVCAGACDAALPLVASRPAYAFNIQASADLIALFRGLAVDLSQDLPHDLVITDGFPAAVEVDPASFQPVPAVGTAGEAVWRFERLPEGGLDLRYTLRPLVAGRVPANRFARLDYMFGLGQPGRAYFPVPVLEVAGVETPTPAPTATPTGTPSATPSRVTPSATSGTPVASPSPTGDGPRQRAYLPYGEQADRNNSGHR